MANSRSKARVAKQRAQKRPAAKASRTRRSGPSRTSSISKAIALGVFRFARPTSLLESLVLVLTSLGVISIVAGLLGALTNGGRVAAYWGVVLLLAGFIARVGFLWRHLPWPSSLRQAGSFFGIGLILIDLVLITADMISHAFGSSSAPLLGPLSTPWLAYGLMAALLVVAVGVIAGAGRVKEVLGFPVGVAAQVRMPRAMRVTRETRIDPSGSSIMDSDDGQVRELLGMPLVQTGDGSRAGVPVEQLKLEMPSARRRVAGQVMLPPIDLFAKPGKGAQAPMDLDAKARIIEQKLASFGVGARAVGYHRGPTVTLYDVEPDPGVKVKRITELQNDLALALAAPTIRIQAPVPGRPVVGIEIPNTTPTIVTMREVLESESYTALDSPLRVPLGKDVTGESVCIDLAKMPHLLIAGSTGSGKSSLLNVLISCLLFQCPPDDVRLVMIDPKMVELTGYNGVPHLLSPVITDLDKVVGVLRWAIREMERRYALFRDSSVRNLARYNQLTVEKGQKKLPYIVLIIDELADLMMMAPDEVEDCICRLAQLARATGIHLVLATQRPSVDVVTGLIKANFPARIAFAMSSQVDSRTILDQVGAEKLLGRGDMLYQDPAEPKPRRLQGAFMSDREIERLVDFWRHLPVETQQVPVAEFEPREGEEQATVDPLLVEAKAVVREYKRASVSLLQRRLSVGYQRAARLMDLLEEQGVVAVGEGGKSRTVIEPEEEEANFPGISLSGHAQ